MPFDSPTVDARRRQVAKRLERDSQPNRSLRIPAERWRFRIRGLVQGVGYRAGCCRRAQELGLAGWVRNCSDGSVEVQAEGDEQRVFFDVFPAYFCFFYVAVVHVFWVYHEV